MKNKYKVIILVNNLKFFITHRFPIAEALNKKGYKIVIAYGESENEDINFLHKRGLETFYIPIYRGSINLFKECKTFFKILRFFIEQKPDLVHLVTIKPYLYGGIISRLTNVPNVVSAVSGLGSLFISKSLKIKSLKLLLYPMFKIAFNHKNQKTIFHNNDDLNYLLRWGVINARKTILVKGSGVNLKNFHHLKEYPGLPVVCFSARLLRDKGVIEFILASKIIKNEGIKARFIIAGDLDKQNPTGLKLDELENLNKDNCVEFLGYQDDIPDLFSKSHIICLPSYREGMPKSLLEAAAASRSIVTTDVPGCRDAIIPNKTGLLVPIKNAKKLAEAIKFLINHPKKRTLMGKEGRRLAEKEYKIEKIIQNHLDIYEELFKKKL